ETWKTATSLYGMLRKGGEREPMLGAALQPMQAYFANRHPSVRAARATVPAATAVDKAQAKAQKRLAQLGREIAALEKALPSASTTVVPTAASAPTAVAQTSEARVNGASLASGAAHLAS